jgi:hypothetical protein
MRQVPGFAKAIAQAFPMIVAGELLAVVMTHQDDVVEAVHIATGLEREFLLDLRPDEFINLGEAVFALNIDFFVRAVLPAAGKLAGSMQAAMMTSSGLPPGLSGQGTGTTTS